MEKPTKINQRFGILLEKYIHAANLTKGQFVEAIQLLSDKEKEGLRAIGGEYLTAIPAAEISKYKTERLPRRDRVISFIYFFKKKGVISLEEANEWLESAKHARLYEREEIEFIFGSNSKQNFPLSLSPEPFQIWSSDTRKLDEIHRVILEIDKSNKEKNRIVLEFDLKSALTKLAELPVDYVPPISNFPAHSHMPFRFNRLFVGREVELKKLAAAFKESAAVAIGQIAAATGLGGIGKTQLATAFVYHYGQYFAGGVYWLNFSNQDRIESEIAKCGLNMPELSSDFSTLDINTQIQLVMTAWQSPIPRLLIFDECEEPALLVKWGPKTGGSRVLVTSRRQEWDAHLGIQTFVLETFTRSQSIEFLRKFRPELLETDPYLEQIAEELGDLPLALHLAGSYLSEHKHIISPEQYLVHLRQVDPLKHRSLRASDFSTDIDDRSPTRHSQHVARTFALSYDRLSPDNPVDLSAQGILAFIAWFAPNEIIPHSLLQPDPGLQMDDEEVVAALAAEDSLRRLVNLGLVETSADGGLIIHRLIAQFAKHTNATISQLSQGFAEETAIQAVTQSFSSGLPNASLPWQVHLRHATDDTLQRTDDRTIELCTALAAHMVTLGDYTHAKPYGEQAVVLSESFFGVTHLRTARCYSILGTILRMQGSLDAAKPYLQKALTIYENAHDQDHLDIALGANDMGQLLSDSNNLLEAKPHLERALKILRSVLGEEHPDTAALYLGLGTIELTLLDTLGAKFHYERALAIYEKVRGLKHPDTANSYHKLGSLLYLTGDRIGAKPYLERALEIRKTELGLKHPDTAESYLGLAMLYAAMDDYRQATSHYEQSLAIAETVYGRIHPTTAKIYYNLGWNAMSLEDSVAAKRSFERALAVYESLTETEDIRVAQSCSSLGMAVYATGDWLGAKPYLERALALYASLIEGRNVFVALTIDVLGRVLEDSGNLDDAKNCFEQSLALYESLLGSRDHRTLKAKKSISSITKKIKENKQNPNFFDRSLAFLFKQ